MSRQPFRFRSEDHVAKWCRANAVQPGKVVPLDVMWKLATVWYHDRLDPGWSRPSTHALQEKLASVGLTAPFWRLAEGV